MTHANKWEWYYLKSDFDICEIQVSVPESTKAEKEPENIETTSCVFQL